MDFLEKAADGSLYCSLCGSWATEAHLDTDKHFTNVGFVERGEWDPSWTKHMPDKHRGSVSSNVSGNMGGSTGVNDSVDVKELKAIVQGHTQSICHLHGHIDTLQARLEGLEKKEEENTEKMRHMERQVAVLKDQVRSFIRSRPYP